MLTPDILIDLEFYPTNKDGRRSPTPENFFGCIFDINGLNHDGRLLLQEIGSIYPGDTKESVPVKFLCADLVIPKLKLGDKLILKEGHVIGEAKVVKIINTDPESSGCE